MATTDKFSSEHRTSLDIDSAISPDVITARGFGVQQGMWSFTRSVLMFTDISHLISDCPPFQGGRLFCPGTRLEREPPV